MRRMYWHEADVVGTNPPIKNHTATLVAGRYILVFGGYDGRNNHNDVHALDTFTMTWSMRCAVKGIKPKGRNGHTATLAPAFVGRTPGAPPDGHGADEGGDTDWHLRQNVQVSFRALQAAWSTSQSQ